MNAKAANQRNWETFLNLFSRQNERRPTRLGIFDKSNGIRNDYWIENGLPLAGIDVDPENGKDSPTVEIILGGTSAIGESHFTHLVKNARTARIVLSLDGAAADSLEIEDAEGKTTVLRFES